MAENCHNTPGLPRKYLAGLPAGTRDRLALFAEWTGCPLFPAEQMLERTEDGDTFSTPFLHYCNEHGMSLDWVWLHDERGVVIAARQTMKGGAA